MKNNQIIIYQSDDGESKIEVNLKEETIWLSQRQMAELFDKDVRTINEHIHNIYEVQELDRDPTIRKFQIVQKEGNREVKRKIEMYNLDMIISVGYRVNSKRGTQFRIWATSVLKNHSFTDGNKRIAAFMFVWFLEENRILFKKDGSRVIADNALVAITLMIAKSDPKEKDLMVKLVVSLINMNN